MLALALAAAELVLAAPDGRQVPVRLQAPPRCRRGETLPLILFSHGANSAPAKYDRLTAGWAARRMLVAAPAHADSTDPAGSAARRLADMRLLIDEAPALEQTSGCRIDRARVAAAGHSYGALVAQMLGGARLADGLDRRDARVRAVVAFSPPGPIPDYVSATGWSSIAVPMFVQTGTADIVLMFAPAWQAHRASYDAARVRRMLFVGDGVDHYFGNLIGRPERTEPPATRAFEAATALSARFMAQAFAGARSFRALARPRRPGRDWIEAE